MNLEEILNNFKTIIVAELNMGQLATILRGRFGIDVKSVTKIQGQPFKIQEIIEGVQKILSNDEKKGAVA